MSERHLVGTERDPVQKCKAFVRSVAVLFLALYRGIKCMEPLSFDRPAETDVVKRFPKWMYPECARDLVYFLRLWRHQFPGFSSASGGLSILAKPTTFSLLLFFSVFSWLIASTFLYTMLCSTTNKLLCSHNTQILLYYHSFIFSPSLLMFAPKTHASKLKNILPQL